MTYDVGNASAADSDAIGSKGAALNHSTGPCDSGAGIKGLEKTWRGKKTISKLNLS